MDGLWVQKAGADQVTDLQPLLDAILVRTGLPISLEGIYRWIAFLPSRVNPRVPVANRYFGAFQDRRLKLRGIEARRHDTAPFIKKIQIELLETLASWPADRPAPEQHPEALLVIFRKLIRRCLADLRYDRIPLADLLVTQKLSREPDTYRRPTPLAQAVAPLQAAGQTIHSQEEG